jgi:hypothetical protein
LGVEPQRFLDVGDSLVELAALGTNVASINVVASIFGFEPDGRVTIGESLAVFPPHLEGVGSVGIGFDAFRIRRDRFRESGDGFLILFLFQSLPPLRGEVLAARPCGQQQHPGNRPNRANGSHEPTSSTKGLGWFRDIAALIRLVQVSSPVGQGDSTIQDAQVGEEFADAFSAIKKGACPDLGILPSCRKVNLSVALLPQRTGIVHKWMFIQ